MPDDDAPPPMTGPDLANKKLAAGLTGILLGAFGVHKFILGYQNEGIIMLAISLTGLASGLVGGFICCLPATLLMAPTVLGVIGLIEGIIYLTMPDEQFARTYVIGRKPWF
ncbi:MAG: TM2 domain-containing protein [Planctomycetota bacterium]